ncbi:MAG: PhnD/SsuA/transferrin family substrate-binding protein [Cyanobacteriota bacterium]
MFISYLDSLSTDPCRSIRCQNQLLDSYAAAYKAMRAGRLHMKVTCTGCTPTAVKVSGFVPFAISAESEDSFGYEIEFIVPVDSDIQTLEDLQGCQMY